MPMKYPLLPDLSVREEGPGPPSRTVTEAAKVLGDACQALKNVMHGHIAIFPKIAIPFDKAVDGGAASWLLL